MLSNCRKPRKAASPTNQFYLSKKEEKTTKALNENGKEIHIFPWLFQLLKSKTFFHWIKFWFPNDEMKSEIKTEFRESAQE